MRTQICSLLLALPLLAQTAGGLRFTPPAGWKSEGSTDMRAATYKLPPATGDADVAECVVYFFGAGKGGSVQDNIDRWSGQFQQPDGKPAAAQVRKRTVHDLPVTTIDVSGVYSGMGGPLATTKSSVPGYRVLGAVIENPGGNIFLKLTGPEKTVAAHVAQFEQLLTSFAKE